MSAHDTGVLVAATGIKVRPQKLRRNTLAQIKAELLILKETFGGVELEIHICKQQKKA